VYQGPPAAAPQFPQAQNNIPQLPRLTQPLKEGFKQPGDLFSKPSKPKGASQGVVEAVGKFAKDHGQSPSSGLSPKSRALLEKAENAVLTPEQKHTMTAQGFTGLFKDWIVWILQTRAGWPFRQEYRRKIATVILGTPYGDVGIIVDAVDALTRFSVCSLEEDKYGNVQRDVKLIIQTFTTTVTKLEAFKKSLGIHWTDVEARQESPEIDTILVALKDGLKKLVEAFGDYSEDLRLSQSEMRMAREAAATRAPERPEMAERR